MGLSVGRISMVRYMHILNAYIIKEFSYLSIMRIVKLKPPQLSPDHIQTKVSCIRAHRERIFQVSTALNQGKLICHNYGQGGAGWTFLFGCVHESIRQFEKRLLLNPTFKNKPIAVIGAGCYGLLTALLLAHKGFTPQIIAKEISNIPSNRAAGFFFPRPRKSSTQEEKTIFTSFGMESYKNYVEIAHGTHPFIQAGPKILPAYFGFDNDPGFAPYVAQSLIQKPEKVIVDFGNGKQYGLMEYKTIFINPAAIMQELHRNVTKLGISIVQKEIHLFNDINEPIVFNCAGMGAKKLTGDKRIIPVQGHLVTLQNQPIEQLQYMINVKVTTMKNGRPRDELIYFAPKDSGILGITFKRGQTDVCANPEEFDRLVERCQDYFGN